MALTSIEICAGAGGQALGLEWAGFNHLAAVEIDKDACNTLRLNRPEWNVVEDDVVSWIQQEAKDYEEVDLVAGGVPCPPFSMAGKQLGADDERDLFPAMVELVGATRPRAVMVENVRGFLSPKFDEYRKNLNDEFRDLGYDMKWQLLTSADFGVPQLRPRAVGVGIRLDEGVEFDFDNVQHKPPKTVGKTLVDLMAQGGWAGAQAWADSADRIAPTLVGGSKKHGGPDLGPTRAREAWRQLGVNGGSVAEEPPAPDHEGLPRLTVQMAARIQGFPDSWQFTGRKTAAYRQVGNAFPPPVAAAVGTQIFKLLSSSQSAKRAA